MKTSQLIGSPLKWAIAVLFVDLMRAIGNLTILAAFIGGAVWMLAHSH